jgi:hypothetical protein
VPDSDAGIEFISPFNVVFTAAGGDVAIPHVERVRYDEQVTSEDFSGDDDYFVREVVPTIARPQASVATLAVAVLDALRTGTVGTLAWTAGDSLNGAQAGGGGIRYTLSRAVFLRRPTDYPYYKNAATEFVFRASSADGRTSPLSSAAI